MAIRVMPIELLPKGRSLIAFLPTPHSRQGGDVRTHKVAFVTRGGRLISASPYNNKRADDRTIRFALANEEE